MQRPTLGKNIEKLVVNAGVGRLSSQAGFSDKILPELIRDFSTITGQHPATRPARKSIAGFKVREGIVVGIVATLRGKRMLSFMDKLNQVVFPRIRDFRGISEENVDLNGNLNIGIKDHLVFPELSPETSRASFGLQITFVPRSVKNRQEAVELYRSIGIPFRKLSHK